MSYMKELAMTNPLIRSLERQHPLSEEERRVLLGAVAREIEFRAGEDMVREHDSPSESKFLLEGWASRYMTLEDGRRQVVGIHVPGDFVDLHSFRLKQMDHSIGAITRCRVATVPHHALNEISENYPNLTRLLWTTTVIDGAVLRQWLLGMGRRSALERMAHQICELFVRLKVVGLTKDEGFQMPVTQAGFADILGISTVHVNRIAQELRRQGVIAWNGATVIIQNWDRLCQIAEFDPIYLNLQDEPR
jgi:CRP-like cAMP-binding protein